MKEENAKHDVVEELLEQGAKANNETIKLALQEFQAEKQRREVSRVVNQLREVQSVLDSEVAYLRQLRQAEKRQRVKVKTISDAKDQFLEDNNFDTFQRTLRGIRNS